MTQKYKNLLAMPVGSIAVLAVEMLLIIALNVFLFENLKTMQEWNLSFFSSEEDFRNMEILVTYKLKVL